MAEAMLFDRPVIATGYSGNVDFMGPETAYPVRYRLTTLQRDYGPYLRGFEWAAPETRTPRISCAPSLTTPRLRRRLEEPAAHTSVSASAWPRPPSACWIAWKASEPDGVPALPPRPMHAHDGQPGRHRDRDHSGARGRRRANRAHRRARAAARGGATDRAAPHRSQEDADISDTPLVRACSDDRRPPIPVDRPAHRLHALATGSPDRAAVDRGVGRRLRALHPPSKSPAPSAVSCRGIWSRAAALDRCARPRRPSPGVAPGAASECAAMADSAGAWRHRVGGLRAPSKRLAARSGSGRVRHPGDVQPMDAWSTERSSPIHPRTGAIARGAASRCRCPVPAHSPCARASSKDRESAGRGPSGESRAWSGNAPGVSSCAR